MEVQFKATQIKILELEDPCFKGIRALENQVSKAHLSYTEAGSMLNRKPDVIAQYVKAGLVSSIQQGPRKVISLSDCYLLEVFFYLTKHYGLSYVACKIVREMLKSNKSLKPQDYIQYIKALELKAEITEDEVKTHVNSYENRGRFAKTQKRKPNQNIQRDPTDTCPIK